MRDEERNNSLLRNMRMHIAEWEAGRPTPAASRYMFLGVAIFLGVGGPVLSYYLSLWALVFLIVWLFLTQWICRRIVPRYNESWAEVFDRIVSRWYQLEAMSVWPEKKPGLKFLHKTTDRSVKTGEE